MGIGKHYQSSLAILNQEAKSHGASPAMVKVLANIMAAESGGDPQARAKTSSAYGLFQFIDSTWNAMDKMSPEITADGRGDPRQQCIAALLFTKQNETTLRNALGRDPSAGELYLAHFLGPAGAKNVLTHNDNESIAGIVGGSVINANAGVRLPNGKTFRDFTVKDLRAWADHKMGADISGALSYAERHDAGETSRSEDELVAEKHRKQLQDLGMSKDQLKNLSINELVGMAFVQLLVNLLGNMVQTPETAAGIAAPAATSAVPAPEKPEKIAALPVQSASMEDVGNLPPPKRPVAVAKPAETGKAH